MHVAARNNVTRRGGGAHTVLFSHGFGCDQNMWRRVAHSFAADHEVVLFDHVGAGGSDLAAYDPAKYADLHGYANDVIEICDGLGRPVTFVGHSVSSTIGVLAAVKRPELFAGLVLICPSPRYANTDTYTGGFAERDIEELLTLIDINHMDWSAVMAPVVVGEGSDADLQDEWRDSVCRTDPAIAKQFARVTFTSDHRAEYRQVAVPSLIIECSADSLAPAEVGAWVHAAISGSRLVTLEATGHCPHVTTPLEAISAVRAFLSAPADRKVAA